MGGNDGMVNNMRWTVYGGEHGMNRMAAPIQLVKWRRLIVNNTGAVIQPLDLIHSFFTWIQVINYDFEFNLEFIHTSVFFKKLTCTGLCNMNFNISFAHWQFFHLQTSRYRPASHKQIVALDWFLYTSVVC